MSNYKLAPVEPATFDDDSALSLAEQVFYTEIDEQLAVDIYR